MKLNNQQNNLVELLHKQTKNSWLVTHNNQQLWQKTQDFIQELENFNLTYRQKPIVFLIESNPLNFMAGLLAAIIQEIPIFLGNPHWGLAELQQVQKLLKPNLIWGKLNNTSDFYCATNFAFNKQSINNLKYSPIIGIPTGGSSGKIRFALHTQTTLTKSVISFSQYFNLNSINSCCTLPLYHVSGLMQFWRSLITEGKLAIVDYQHLKQGFKPTIQPQDYLISLVPTQLQYLLENELQWLSQFKTILLGGAPAWRSLLTTAQQHNLPIATTYGMTETASGISYLKPQYFLQGNYSNGQILPHAQVTIINNQHQVLKCNQVGIIKIEAESLCQGYFPPNCSHHTSLVTDDLGLIDREGFLHVLGRNSQKIITGGENVYPPEVEAAIFATKLVKDVCVIGIEDAQWGQTVTALLVPFQKDISIKVIQQKLQLSKYKIPKNWLSMESLPRDQKGKINYTQLKLIAQKILKKKQMS